MLWCFTFLAGDIFAFDSAPAPADCVSLTGYYGRAPDDIPEVTFANPLSTLDGYKPYFRVFIPPGAIVEDLNILENHSHYAVARHKVPPIGLPWSPPAGYVYSNPLTLSELESADQWAKPSSAGLLYITTDSFYDRLPISRAGWLYVKVSGSDSEYYTTQFVTFVDTKPYNEWFDKYIKDEAGWNKYIQDVETYVDPTIVPILSVSPASQKVAKEAGVTTFAVSNAATVTMPWTAIVVSGGEWLSITSGSSGTDAGTINCSFTANIGPTERVGIVRVTADGATGSPTDVTVTQAATLETPTLKVSPSYRLVSKDAGSTIFRVTSTGISWSAEVTSGENWLWIESDGNGTGVVTCKFVANTNNFPRRGTIRIAATDAAACPVDVTVIQQGEASQQTACLAVLDIDFLLQVPILLYTDPTTTDLYFWADFLQDIDAPEIYKLVNSGILIEPSLMCLPATVSDDLKIHIPDALFTDGSHYWMDLEFDTANSIGEDFYFKVTDSGVLSH